MALRYWLFPRWSNLSPTKKGIAAFALCFVLFALLSFTLRACFADKPLEAVSILSLDRLDDVAALTTPYMVGTVLVIETKPNDLPGTWMRCEGQTLRTEDYPDLAAVLGASPDATSGGQVSLPDYRGLSVARFPERVGILRWLATGTRRTHGNLTMIGASSSLPVPGMMWSELSMIIRVR